MKIRALVSESSRTSKRSPLLEHECALREQLDRSWTTRAVVITRNWDRPVLVLEDPAERLLIIYLAARSIYLFNGAWPIGLSYVVGHLHRRGLIHKNLKPGNILVNSVTGQCSKCT
jgi:serine/threonine protein kinase